MMIKSIAFISGLALAQGPDGFSSESRLPFLGENDFAGSEDAGAKVRDKNNFSNDALNAAAAAAVLDSTYGNYDYDSIMSEVQTLLTANGVVHTETNSVGDFAQSVSAGRPNAPTSGSSSAGAGGRDFTAEEGFTGTTGLTCQKCSGSFAFCAQTSNAQTETCNESQGACRVRIERTKSSTMITMGCANYNSCQHQRLQNSNAAATRTGDSCNNLFAGNTRFQHITSVCHQCCTRDNCFTGDDSIVKYVDNNGADTDVTAFTIASFASGVTNDGANA